MLAHVHRNIANGSVRLSISFQQRLGFARAAGAQLDDGPGAGQAGDGPRVRLENRRLGSGEIVLGSLADALEQLAALGVIEEPAGEPPRVVAQPTNHRPREIEYRVRLR